MKRLANALAALAPHGHEGAAARLLGVIGAPLAQGGRERPTCARLFVQRAGPAALAQADELVPVLVQGVERLRGALRL